MPQRIASASAGKTVARRSGGAAREPPRSPGRGAIRIHMYTCIYIYVYIYVYTYIRICAHIIDAIISYNTV